MQADAGDIALAVAADHPAYAGHFPGRPVLPGVVLLAESLAALESPALGDLTAWTLASVKFVRPVLPGTALRLRHQHLDSGSIRFEVHGPDGPVATGTLAPRRAPGSAP
jgi:3-hydroxymyristoyl/3-hydroxydecanoyl-(acyl carrier protein) dehydratase